MQAGICEGIQVLVLVGLCWLQVIKDVIVYMCGQKWHSQKHEDVNTDEPGRWHEFDVHQEEIQAGGENVEVPRASRVKEVQSPAAKFIFVLVHTGIFAKSLDRPTYNQKNFSDQQKCKKHKEGGLWHHFLAGVELGIVGVLIVVVRLDRKSAFCFVCLVQIIVDKVEELSAFDSSER